METPRKKKSRNQLIILICILISFILWLPIKLSKNYSRDIIVSLQITPPPGKAFTSAPPGKFPLRIIGTGSQLLSMSRRLLKDTLIYRIPTQQEEYLLTASELIDLINKRYETPAGLSITSPVNAYQFGLDSLVTETLPIRSKLKLEFKDNFGPYQAIDLDPDSVLLTGARSIISGLTEIQTEASVISEIENDMEFQAQLNNPFPALLDLNFEQCLISIPASEMTEKEVQVPVELSSPRSEDYKLFPNKISVTINVPIKIYNDIQAANIELKLSPQGKNAYSISVARLPLNTAYISHRPKIVRYLQASEPDNTTESN